MSKDKPQYEIRPMDKTCPDGTYTRFYEVYEIMMVEGVEKDHRNMDIAFKTEEEARLWIKKHSGNS